MGSSGELCEGSVVEAASTGAEPLQTYTDAYADNDAGKYAEIYADAVLQPPLYPTAATSWAAPGGGYYEAGATPTASPAPYVPTGAPLPQPFYAAELQHQQAVLAGAANGGFYPAHQPAVAAVAAAAAAAAAAAGTDEQMKPLAAVPLTNGPCYVFYHSINGVISSLQ